ncbi:MAG: cytochrome b/b6 domain-containing protein [Gammaproteobacteria bacterium]|nr:cytochrome b/b6 domain-containing protein [Gammaproteobacteria bacterium]
MWRFVNPKPEWPDTMSLAERLAARLVHGLLYLLILIVPISGWIMSTAAGYSPSFWGWFTLAMPGIPYSKALAMTANQIHTTAIWVLGILIILHLLAALKHHFINKDNILKRMM